MESPQASEEGYFTAQEELETDSQILVAKAKVLATGGFGSVLPAWHKVKMIPLVVKVTRMTEDDAEDDFLWDNYETELDFYERSVGRSDISWIPTFYGSGLMKFEDAECPW